MLAKRATLLLSLRWMKLQNLELLLLLVFISLTSNSYLTSLVSTIAAGWLMENSCPCLTYLKSSQIHQHHIFIATMHSIIWPIYMHTLRKKQEIYVLLLLLNYIHVFLVIQHASNFFCSIWCRRMPELTRRTPSSTPATTQGRPSISFAVCSCATCVSVPLAPIANKSIH